MKDWYTSKTLWANIVALAGAGATWASTGDTTALVAAGTAALMAAVNIVLRLVTTKPIASPITPAV